VDGLLKAEEAQAAVGSRAAAGRDRSNVRRFMDAIVAEDGRYVEKVSAGAADERYMHGG
jgi:hypothetical protein